MADSDRRPARAGPKPGDQDPSPLLIVGIGASAGGLEAYQTFLKHLPPDSGMAFVLVQHLLAKRPSLLVELLGRHTKMPVLEAADGAAIERDHLYVIPPNASLTVEGGCLRVRAPMAAQDRQTVIDRFLTSLAEDQGQNAVCIILSGAGREGTVGVRAVKEHGGLTMAQDVESAAHPSMPGSAAAAGFVDLVLEVAKMPQALISYAANLRRINGLGHVEPIEARAATHLGRIYELLRRRKKHNFSEYKESTVLRRIQRRMQVLQLADVAAYVERLETEPGELEHLFRDLLIGVTRFFRDPEAFHVLAQKVIPAIVEGKGAADRIRVWVPGCASGEEAYSIGILLLEQLQQQPSPPQVQIFATDIDEAALAVARAGVYPAAALTDLPSRLVERFFVQENSLYRLSKRLRETCMFAVQNVIADPPFSRLDLISCRNLLIYLAPQLQNRVVPLFHYALRDDGFLFLGSAENVGRHSRLFLPVDRKQRIYRSRIARAVPRLTFPADGSARRAGAPAQQRRIPVPEPSPGQWAHDIVLQRHAPPYLVVDEHFEVIEFSTGLAPFLDPAGGAASLNVFGLIHDQLRTDLRTALQKAKTSRALATQAAVRVARNGDRRLIDLVVEPRVVDEREVGQFVVILKDHPLTTEVGPPAPRDLAETTAVQRLEGELRATRERLETTVEQLETSNEELASSNEELLSMNEELQSSNEELEASQEELQSLNEELETINAQLAEKVEELDRAQDDLVNLLDATLFLDADLGIKRFTPGLTDVIALQSGDEGRFLGDFALKFEDPGLLAEVRSVIRDGTVQQVEVTRREDGHVFLLRITPYHRVADAIEGAVLSFVDITRIKAVERQLRTYQRRAEVAIAASRGGLYEHGVPPGADTYCNDGWAEILGYAAAELPDAAKFLDWLLERTQPRERASLEQAYDAICGGRTDRYDVQVRLRHKDGHWLWVRWVAQPVERDEQGRVTRIAGLMFDVSREREAGDQLMRTAARLRVALDAGGMGIWDLDRGVVAWDERTYELLGLERADARPSLERFLAAVHPDDRDELSRAIEQAIASGERYGAEFRVVLPDGGIRRLGLQGQVRRDEAGQAVGMIGVSFERSDRGRGRVGAVPAQTMRRGATATAAGDGSAP